MNNAPAVYVPTQPEGDGLKLPALLSVLAHGIVIGLLVYTYQQPVIEAAGSIETTMVSPGELAEMQGQILANRAAADAQAASSSAAATEQASSSESNAVSQNSSQPNSQQVPVFIRSDDPASQPMLMSEEQHQQRLEQMEEYNRNMAEWAAELDDATMDKLEDVEQDRRQQQSEDRQTLKEYRNKSNNPPRIQKPTRSDRNINIDLGGSDNAGKTFDLSDGRSTMSGSAGSSSQSTGSNNSNSGGSRGASYSEIINLIRRNYNPPTGAKGSTQRATLTITVNASGNVVNVSVSGSDSAVNDAAKQAVLNTRNFPIDTDDPKYPTFTVQFNGSS